MQESLYQTADAGVPLSDSDMQEYLHQTADAGVSIRQLMQEYSPFRQQMQETLYQTADAESLYKTADARDYQTAEAGDTLSDSG